MALYHTDFGDEVIGQPPAGWSPRWGTSGWDVEVVADGTAPSGRAVQAVKGGTALGGPWRGLAWDQIDLDPARGSFETLALVRADTADAQGNDASLIGPIGRGTGTQDNEGFVAGTLYVTGGVHGVQVVRRVAGNAARSTSTAPPFRWEFGQWWWLRLRAVQQMFFVRFWPMGSEEPEGWSVTRVDEAIPEVGWVGVGAFRPGTYRLGQITVTTLEPGDWGMEPALPIG
jgi:hypothetical protein